MTFLVEVSRKHSGRGGVMGTAAVIVVNPDEEEARRLEAVAGPTIPCTETSSGLGLKKTNDNVLYHSLSGLVSGQQLRVVCPIQRLSAHWFAPAKCAHWHF
jgi:hypothetical protein